MVDTLRERHMLSLSRLKARRIENEAIQFRSHQALRRASIERLEQIGSETPGILYELSRKRSLRFKSPRNFSVNDLPPDKVKQILTPHVIRKDQEACQHIMDAITKEESKAMAQRE